MLGKIYQSKFGKVIYPLFKVFKPTRVKTKNGFIMNVHKDRDWISDKILLKKEWEPYKEDFFNEFIKVGDSVADVGANIGYYTLLFSKLVGDDGEVYAFEPETANFKILKKNVLDNGLKNVETIKKAISDKKGHVKLNFGEKTHGGGTILDYHNDYGSELVSNDTLDNFFKGKKIDFLKLDMEGSELEALKHGTETLKKVRTILIEFRPDSLINVGVNPRELMSVLEKNDFLLYAFDNENTKIIPFNSKTFEEMFIPGTYQDLFQDILCLKNVSTLECSEKFIKKKDL